MHPLLIEALRFIPVELTFTEIIYLELLNTPEALTPLSPANLHMSNESSDPAPSYTPPRVSRILKVVFKWS